MVKHSFNINSFICNTRNRTNLLKLTEKESLHISQSSRTQADLLSMHKLDGHITLRRVLHVSYILVIYMIYIIYHITNTCYLRTGWLKRRACTSLNHLTPRQPLPSMHIAQIIWTYYYITWNTYIIYIANTYYFRTNVISGLVKKRELAHLSIISRPSCLC